MTAGMNYRRPVELDYYVTPDGVEYRFDNGHDTLLMSFTGDGMPPFELIEQQGPYQHGKTILDYRLTPRIIQFVHRRQGDNRFDYWDIRGELLNLFRPNRESGSSLLGKLRKILPDGTERDIDVMFSKGFAFNARATDEWDEWSVQDVIQFIAPDPTFYNPTAVTVVWSITPVEGLIFYSASALTELHSPWVFGSDVVTGTSQVHYTGTWLTYPTIEFVGPLNIPTIENVTTSERIQLDYNIAAGETVTVALPFGNKTVTNNLSANLIGYVSTDSDLATFHIAPEPEATWCGTHTRPCGLNVFSVGGGAGVVGQTQVRMTYNVRYVGI